MINEPANWEEAGFKCRSLARGSHLIVVEDETENLAVVQYLLSMKGLNSVIIRLYFRQVCFVDSS